MSAKLPKATVEDCGRIGGFASEFLVHKAVVDGAEFGSSTIGVVLDRVAQKHGVRLGFFQKAKMQAAVKRLIAHAQKNAALGIMPDRLEELD